MSCGLTFHTLHLRRVSLNTENKLTSVSSQRRDLGKWHFKRKIMLHTAYISRDRIVSKWNLPQEAQQRVGYISIKYCILLKHYNIFWTKNAKPSLCWFRRNRVHEAQSGFIHFLRRTDIKRNAYFNIQQCCTLPTYNSQSEQKLFL